MRKILFLFVLLVVSFTLTANTRTWNTKVFSANPEAEKYASMRLVGGAADSLTIVQDSLLIPFVLNKSFPCDYYIKLALDSIDGVDTTVIVNIKGRMFDDEAWTLIETTTTAVISAEINTVIESITDADYTLGTASAVDFLQQTLVANKDTLTVAARTATPTVSIKPFWRQLLIELVISGNDSVGKGVLVKDVEIYLSKAL